MNLISCDKCGGVFDKDRIEFSEEIFNEKRGEYDLTKCTYVEDGLGCGFVPFVPCPICKEGILLNRT